MHAVVKYTGGLQFVGESGTGHAIIMDGDPEVGGNDTAPRPTELLLVGLGGCTAMDTISILKKKRQPVEGLEIILKGEKAENHPKRFTRIQMEYVVKGKGIDESAVKRAIQLSTEKYCSVKATLEGNTDVSFSYRIEEA
jgi:putative redox protein